VIGVDSGMGATKRHGNARRTMGELAEGGYPVPEALAAVTSVAAAAAGLRLRPTDSRPDTPPTYWSSMTTSPRILRS
jgi:hypothetical protein